MVGIVPLLTFIYPGLIAAHLLASATRLAKSARPHSCLGFGHKPSWLGR